MERETGFEPATSTLARLHSTTELLPQHRTLYRLHVPVVNFFLGRKLNREDAKSAKKDKRRDGTTNYTNYPKKLWFFDVGPKSLPPA